MQPHLRSKKLSTILLTMTEVLSDYQAFITTLENGEAAEAILLPDEQLATVKSEILLTALSQGRLVEFSRYSPRTKVIFRTWVDPIQALGPYDEERDTAKQRLNVAEVFRSIRRGAYLDPTDLAVISSNSRNTHDVRVYADIALNKIDQNGNDSIAHLCLPADVRNTLHRADVDTIEQAKKGLETGDWPKTIGDPRNFGQASRTILLEALADFERVLKTQTVE